LYPRGDKFRREACGSLAKLRLHELILPKFSNSPSACRANPFFTSRPQSARDIEVEEKAEPVGPA